MMTLLDPDLHEYGYIANRSVEVKVHFSGLASPVTWDVMLELTGGRRISLANGVENTRKEAEYAAGLAVEDIGLAEDERGDG